MFTTTKRRVGNPVYGEDEPKVTFGRGPDGRPAVIVTGGQRLRRASGIGVSSLANLKALRRDLDEAIDLMTVAEREASDG